MVNWELKRRISETFGSQCGFAEALGIAEASVSRVIRGRKELSKSERQRWAGWLRCKPEDIFPENRVEEKNINALR